MPTEVPPTKVSDLALKTTPVVEADRLMVIDSSDGLSKQMSPSRLNPFSLTGGLLYRWNKTDTTQFDAVQQYAQSGGAEAGSATLTVVDTSPFFTGNVLRVSYTGLQGGAMFPVALGALPLPARYVIFVRMSGAVTPSNTYGAVHLHCDPSPGGFSGLLLGRSTLGNGFLRVAYADRDRATATITSAGLLSAADIALGGCDSIVTVEVRPYGLAAAASIVALDDKRKAGGHTIDSADPAIAAGANWGTEDHGRVGLGALGLGTALSGTVDFADFRVYAHPDD